MFLILPPLETEKSHIEAEDAKNDKYPPTREPRVMVSKVEGTTEDDSGEEEATDNELHGVSPK